MQTRTRARNGGANKQVSIENGMEGERHLEAMVVICNTHLKCLSPHL
jgi:hypothetical protein